MGSCSRRRLIAYIGTCLLGLSTVVTADDVLVTVNGRKITEAELQLEAILRRVPDGELEAHRGRLLDDLIDRRLIEGFLTRKRIKPGKLAVASQVEQAQALIRRRGEEPKELFDRLGIDEEQLRQRLWWSLAWDQFVAMTATKKQRQTYFDEHRRELDGTQLRARHILIKVPADDEAQRKTARETLSKLRKPIVSGDVDFAALAKGHSQGPSRNDGGDIGYFGHRGTMSADFSDAAFAIKVGEVSEPVETSFGVHLIEVTDERPGELSLEDVRNEVLGRLSQQWWTERVAQERVRAKIVLSE